MFRYLEALAWTLECIVAHRLDKIIIAGEDAVLTKVIERPKSKAFLYFSLSRDGNFFVQG